MDSFDETFLARWANGSLTPEEKKSFESSSEFPAYQKLLLASDRFKAPAYPEDQIFSEIQKQVQKKPIVRMLAQRFMYAAAAVLIVSLGVLWFANFSEQVVKTGYGKQLSVFLPDSSEVILNAKSSIRFHEKNWKENRNITLQGEAYFKVKKGTSFTVQTDEGSVEVLGTSFNVTSHPDFFEVRCYTGKVRVTNTYKEEVILIKGKAHRTSGKKIENFDFDPDLGFWTSGKSTFNRTPFLEVIRALEDQYGIQFENTDAFKDEIFTGRFSNNNLDLALKTVFDAMQIAYQINGKTITLSK